MLYIKHAWSCQIFKRVALSKCDGFRNVSQALVLPEKEAVYVRLRFRHGKNLPMGCSYANFRRSEACALITRSSRRMSSLSESSLADPVAPNCSIEWSVSKAGAFKKNNWTICVSPDSVGRFFQVKTSDSSSGRTKPVASNRIVFHELWPNDWRSRSNRIGVELSHNLALSRRRRPLRYRQGCCSRILFQAKVIRATAHFRWVSAWEWPHRPPGERPTAGRPNERTAERTDGRRSAAFKWTLKCGPKWIARCCR